MLYCGSAIDILNAMKSNSVQCCVTSPPYFGLRNYKSIGQIGQERSYQEYVANLVSVFDQVRRVLKDDGTLWLNIGDSYARDERKGQHKPGDSGKQEYVIANGGQRAANGIRIAGSGLKPKCLMMIPARLAIALQDSGWYLRSDVIWHKPNPLPESVLDRPTKSYEHVFLLSKSERYYYNASAIAEPCVKGAAGSLFYTGKTAEHQLGRMSTKPRARGNKYCKYVTAYESSDTDEHRVKAGLLKISNTAYATRNKRDVWVIATQPNKIAHFATFPEKLVEPCVFAGCPPGGLVLDPFMGSGTVGVVCKKYGREFVGIDLNPDYVAMAERRIASAVVPETILELQ